MLDSSHYAMLEVKEKVLRYMACQKYLGKNYGAVMLLAGPPGVGKTSIAVSIAKAMGRPCVKISLAGVSDALFLRGTQTVFNNAKPGRIVDALVHGKSFCSLILLDEIDKMGSVVADITGSSGHCRITSIYDKRQKANCERIHLAKTDQGVSNRAGRY